jgi:lysophospholipase L1-like esterase
MKRIFIILLGLFWILSGALSVGGVAEKATYLRDIKIELEKKWPANRTINIVFHGHSVPSGYFRTPVVNTFDSYPYLLLKRLKERYPYAVINVIVTSIGGENSVQGAERFVSDVLTHKPDILFIDYSLNDVSVGFEKSRQAWDEMIRKALETNVKVLLMTPSPDQRFNILEPNSVLEQHRNQVAKLAEEHGVGLIDSYSLFKEKVQAGEGISDYMAQVNHPNKNGHQLIVNEIFKYFE